MNRARRSGVLLALLVAVGLALFAYYLPWVDHSTAGFTMNAFDLAEWASLHPAVRSSSPPLLASFLLRAPHVASAIAIALVAYGCHDTRWRVVGWAAALLLALRMAPPVEFWQGAHGDPNYRQMLLLTAFGVVGVGVAAALARTRATWSAGGIALLLGLGAVSGWVGLSRIEPLLDNFQIAVSTGPGPVLYTAVTAAVGVLVAWQTRAAKAAWADNKKGD